jgi:hypothetical protein
MGAGPLHLLKPGLAVRLEDDGHQVAIRSVELPPEFRATEIASTFELSAALARGVAEAVKTGHLPTGSIRKLWTGGPGCVGGLQSQTKIFEKEAAAFHVSDVTCVHVQSLRADLPKALSNQDASLVRRPMFIWISTCWTQSRGG